MAGLLEGQVATVTGAAQGIGLAIAQSLVGQSASVLLADVNGTQTSAAAKAIDPAAAGRACNVTNAADVDASIAAARERFGGLDIRVNNASVTRDGHVAKMTEDAFDAVMPGLMRSAMTLAMKPETFAAKEAEVPVSRAGEPSDVAGAVMFLCSGLASYVNGAIIEMTGGWGI